MVPRSHILVRIQPLLTFISRLVQEFMLSANTAVAQRIYNTYKDPALLRRQLPPKAELLQDAVDQCQEIGIEIDGSTNRDLQVNKFLLNIIFLNMHINFIHTKYFGVKLNFT